jgi:uncharacterized protein
MDMTGEQKIAAPREAVWRALNDADTLRQSIPGCETLERVSETEFTATVAAKLGPVNAKFSGRVTLSDIVPPISYMISGEGSGGVAGFAKGGAKVELEEVPDGTLLRYTVNAQVGGKIAQIGSRLIDASARKLANDFFARFSQNVAVAEPQPPAAAAAPPAAAPVTPAAAPGMTMPSLPPAAGLPSWAWIAGVVAFVLLIIWYFSGR